MTSVQQSWFIFGMIVLGILHLVWLIHAWRGFTAMIEMRDAMRATKEREARDRGEYQGSEPWYKLR